jgi:hypothetical protein
VALDPADAAAFANRCLARAQSGNALATALADCDTSLKLQPDMAEFLEDRALVHLRLGQVNDAVADYNAAMAKTADPSALYGRGLARLRSGDAADGQADIASATAADPKVAIVYAQYGLTP